MTALLKSPVSTLDGSRLEERQPDVPLTCTLSSYPTYHDRCSRPARWEAMCLVCGHVFRRCQPHYEEEVEIAADWDGAGNECATCYEAGRPGCLIYIAQYVRISA